MLQRVVGEQERIMGGSGIISVSKMGRAQWAWSAWIVD